MDGSTPETCRQCGFDSRRWTLRDAAGLFEGLGWWWENATAGFSDNDLNRRPGPAVWSVLEYGLHTALAAAVIRTEAAAMLADDGRILDNDFEIGDATEDNWAILDRTATIADLHREGDASAALARLSDASWGNVGSFRGRPLQAEAYLIHDVHDASHHMMDASSGLAALSDKPPEEGCVEQINVSDGGVPKHPIPGAALSATGVEGDRQRDRKHHGRPFQAVCLWSAEVIERLAADGHPIGPGCAGENLTFRSVDWQALRPGALVHVGGAVIELSFPAVPCHNQVRWFSDGDFSRIHHDVNPQRARWYGWVRAPGTVHAGDPVLVET